MAEQTARSRRPGRVSSAQLEYHALLLVTLALVAFGLIMVYSASSGTAVVEGRDPLTQLIKQGIWAALGVGMLAAFMRFPYRRLRYVAAPALFVSIGLLVLVMLPHVGTRLNGAQRWIFVGPVSVQPSEIAKGAVLIFTAAVLAARRKPPQTIAHLMSPVGAVVLAVCALVVFEPDLGTAISIAVMTGGVLLVAGTRLRLFVTSAGVLAAAAGLMVYIEPFRMQRILAFVDPWRDPAGSGYQNVQALLSLGSGGLFGHGLGNGTQKITYLPEAPTDMIFAVVGEELGLVGVLATVLGFAVFAFLGFRIALRCRDPFGKYLATGVTCLVTGQAIVNFGAVLGLLPLTGVPLPLISSGGSSLVVMLAMVGVMLNIAETGGAGARAGASSRDDEHPSTASTRATSARSDRGRRYGRSRRAGTGGGRRAVG
ncbi:MAG: putative lipid II flippase FtsW [Gaiellales bacterium]